MRKGFTIIELLVASLLLGMLMTILTMIFNQSSIAWRTGMAGTQNMGTVRENIAQIREEADNAFIWNNRLYRNTGLWDKNGKLRNRSCDADTQKDGNENHPTMLGNWLSNLSNTKPEHFMERFVGSSGSSGSAVGSGLGGNTGGGGGGIGTYTVNVKSAGPDRQFDTYDDIWSWPDDFD